MVLPALACLALQVVSAHAEWQPKVSTASDAYTFAPAMLCGGKPSSEVEAGAILEKLGLKRTATGWSFRDSTGLTTVYGRAENHVMFVEFVPATRTAISQSVLSVLTAKAERVEMRTPTELAFRFATDMADCSDHQIMRVTLPNAIWVATLRVVNWE